MRKYARYKDSGISWIGEVPEHWETKRIRHIFNESDEKVEDDSGELLSLSQYTGVSLKKNCEKSGMFEAETTEGYKVVHKNQFVMNIMLAWNGSYAVSNLEGVISPAYCVFDFIIDCEPKFFHYLLRIKAYSGAFKTLSKGIIDSRLRLYPSKFYTFPVIVPPLSEQKAIAEYLDKKTAQINELVSAKQKQIELLKEYKQSVIANAVTGKLDERREKRKWKDSGISWIGKIPENWEIKRAKYMFKKEKRDVRDSDDVVTCFRDGEVTLRKNRRTSGFTESITEIGYQGIRKNDLVIHQMDAFAGAIGVSDSDGKGTSVYHCCTPLGDYDVRYYASLLRIMAKKGFIQSLYRGIRERSSDFNFQVFGKQYLVVPPLSEQKEIVAYIEKKVSSIDSQIASIENQIANLNEYKQSLISDVVTGKVKV